MAAASAGTLAAQDQPSPAPGTRVQVWAPRRFDGTLRRVTPTSLFVQTDGSSPTEIALSRVREFRIEHGTHGHAVRGGLLGFLGGLLLGGQTGAVAGGGFGALLGSQIRGPRFERRSVREVRPTPLPGTWVRVTTEGDRTEGTVLAVTTDSLVVDVAGRVRAIPARAISAVEWPIGRDRLGRSGFLTGAAIGAGAGALAGLALGSECRNSDHFLCGDGGVAGSVIAVGVAGAGVAGLVGWAIGHGVSRTRWEAASPASAGLAFRPLLSPGRIGVAGAIRF